MKRKFANRLALCVEILLSIIIIGIVTSNFFDNAEQEVKQYESGLESDYQRLMDAYTTDFKMMVNEITPQIDKDISFDDMQEFLHTKENIFEEAIGADVYDGISFTYKGGYAHSWDYGDYSDYEPSTRPWYKIAQEADGEIAVTAPYVTYLNESELAGTDDYIVLSLTEKYNDDVSFCYDIKTFAINELLSERYSRYSGTFAIMYDNSGYVLSSTVPEYYCHNIYKTDDVISKDIAAAIKENENKKDTVRIAWKGFVPEFMYYTTDPSGNNYAVMIPFWSVMQRTFLGSFIIAIVLIFLEIWIYIRTNKQLEVELELERVKNTSQMKQDFLARMSHDMRTPMNGILGVSELSAEEDDSEVLKDNMKKIHSAGEYLLGLINDSLDLQKIESGKFTLNPTVVSTSQLIGDAVDMIKVSAKEKGVDFSIKNVNADLGGYVLIDDMRMKQIFVNLLSNAIKFTPAGGKVELSFEVIERKGNIVHDRISVSDTGSGMSEDFIKNRIFTPFSQENNNLTNDKPGTGLGLSIVKKLVEVMGATISVESELGKGTTFAVDIDFQCVEEPNKEILINENKLEEEYDMKELAGKHILLAEDHSLNAEIATKILEKAGCIVTWVKDGRQCVEMFEKSPEYTFDIILMDIRMPVMDGLEATKTIRTMGKSDSASIPIIAMSANAYDEDIDKSMDAGMDAHISKPIQITGLYKTIYKFVERDK